jgi:N-acetylglucosamine-6-phosphate deacetylase
MRLGVEAALVDGTLVPGDVEIEDGLVSAVALSGAGTGIASPGFLDLQVNGFGGVDLASADRSDYRRAGERQLETGTTAYQPTFITAPEDDLLASLREVPTEPGGPRILGVHVEGPFLSPARMGAHPPSARRDPDVALVDRLRAAGPVTYMTLAPERPGALTLVDHLRSAGIVVSAGHSNATAAEAGAGFDRGIRTVTHLFNAMRPLGHRDPGIAGAALAREDVVVQLVVDGVHLAPETVLLCWRAAAGRLALVTDAIAAAGEDDGSYRLAGVDVEVREGVARRADGVLAGSTLTMIGAVRNLHALGAPLAGALDAATRVPAGVVGRPELGTLAPGTPADVVVLDDRLEVQRVLVGGQTLVTA